VLDLCAKIFGTEHPDYASALANLGLVYEKSGKIEKAEEYYSKALDIRRRILGKSHRQFIENTKTLADLYEKQGKSDKAKELRAEIN